METKLNDLFRSHNTGLPECLHYKKGDFEWGSPFSKAEMLEDNYHPLVNKGAMWYSRSDYSIVLPEIKMNSDILEDTIDYNGKKYLKLNEGYYALREDINERKVYFLENGQEKLLYDFSLNVGDTIEYFIDKEEINCYDIVDSISTITLKSGGTRKIWFLTSYINGFYNYSDIWIESIGSVVGRGVMNPIFSHLLNSSTTEFGCFKYNDILYTNTEATASDECPCTFLIDDIDNSNVKSNLLYPNPATDHITIKNSQGNLMDIQIVDLTGRTVKRMTTNNTEITINLDHVPSGLYFVRMNGESYKLIVK